MAEAEKKSLQRLDTPAASALAALIGAQGPVSLAEFMQRAASEYYATRQPFGVSGDFTTAPEISQMFGELIAAWVADIWTQMGKPSRLLLVEPGPGRGTLAVDMLRALATWPDCRAAVSLHLVETSPTLRIIQQEALKDCGASWHDGIETLPQGPAVFIANEFLDALPVRQFVFAMGAWRERLVDYHPARQQFRFVLGSEAVLVELPQGYPPPADGDIFETSPASHEIIRSISGRVASQGGAALFIDYGDDLPAYGDTTQGFYRQSRAGILDRPGAQDVTANVDFHALAATAAAVVDVYGPVTQGAFLGQLGIGQRAEQISRNASAGQRQAVESALQRLTSPAAMGNLFKVMALAPKGGTIHPAGFEAAQ